MRFLLRTKHFFDLFFNYLEFSILCINMYQCSYRKKMEVFLCAFFSEDE